MTGKVFIGAIRLSLMAKRRCPAVVMEDKPAQREHRLRGVTKQHDYRRSEPISPAGNLVGAPKGICGHTAPNACDPSQAKRFKGASAQKIRVVSP